MVFIKKHLIFIFVLSLLSSTCLGLGGDKNNIDIEWIHSDEASKAFSLPHYKWLNKDRLIILNQNQPKEQIGFEILDQSSGKLKPLLKLTPIFQELWKKYGIETDPKSYWPTAFDNNGERAIYIFSGDIFLLHLVDGHFSKITSTGVNEKCVKFSPDGQKISFVRENDIYFYDIEKKTEVRLTKDGSETLLNGTLSWVYWEEIFGRQDLAYWWSGDSRSIAFLKTDESDLPISYFVDTRSVHANLITQRYPKAGDPTPSVELHVIEVDSKKACSFDPDPNNYEYIVRVKWLPDNRRVCVQTLNRQQTKLDVYFLDSNNGQHRHILTDTDDAWITMSNDLYFLTDSEEFIFASERDGYNHLYRYDLDGDLINQITKGEWSLFTSGKGVFWVNQTVCAIDEKNKHIYFTALEKSSVERHLYRINFDGAGMVRLTEEDGTHAISFSPDTRYYLDRFSNISTFPKFNLHKNSGKKITTIASSGSSLDKKRHIKYPELFHIKAKDGFLLPATLLKPTNFDPTKKYPVIINVYGGPGAPTVIDAWKRSILFDQVLLENGFLVFRVDNRHATGISKKVSSLVLYELIGQKELDDILDAVAWLKSQSFIDEGRIGIYGWSGGGGFTLSAMTRSKEFKAGISGAAISSWYNYNVKLTEMANKRPQDNPEGYEETSLVNRAKDLHGRLLIIHGTYDDNVHPQHMYQFVDALIEAGKLFEMVLYPMRKHKFTDKAAIIHREKVMLDFWKRNL